MPYILRKGIYYCGLDENGAIFKTQDIKAAARFETVDLAKQKLSMATKKLSGYKVINMEDMREVSTRTKRKQITTDKRIKVYNRSKGRCAICGDFIPFDEFTVDHITPLAKGGTNDISNLQSACKTCNHIKQDILPQDLISKLTQIILYQLRTQYNDTLWRELKKLRKRWWSKRLNEFLGI